ncbi:MAG: 5-(carboxyamino)imidazole ribonucleotide mutase [Bdellovibrionales bacterium]
MKPQVAVIMGSDSDMNVMSEAVNILESAGVVVEVKIVSAHRTPKNMQTYAAAAAKRGLKVIIAGAGGAAHLPGMVASLTHLPVIGVPVTVGKLKGLDALLSVAQMPRGIPVATVAVDNSANAGLLAIRILAVGTPKLKKWLEKYQASMQKKVSLANRRLKQTRKV